MWHGPADEDIDAIAHRVVALIANRLNAVAPTVIPPPAIPATMTKAPKLTSHQDGLAEELSMSPVSIWRLEQRGLLKSVPGLRTKLYSWREVDRYLNECEKRIHLIGAF